MNRYILPNIRVSCWLRDEITFETSTNSGMLIFYFCRENPASQLHPVVGLFLLREYQLR